MDDLADSRRPDSFFKAQETFDTALYHGDLHLTAAECSVFRYLLINVWYRPANEADYGLVNRKAVEEGEKDIARMVCLGRSATGSALRGLEAKGMIRRTGRPQMSGGRKSSDIKVIWLAEGVKSRHSERSESGPSESVKSERSIPLTRSYTQEGEDHGTS
jgi:hypothetical protein